MTSRVRGQVRFVRVNDFEDRLLAALMMHERVTISEAIRLAIREAVKSRGLWPEERREEGAT